MGELGQATEIIPPLGIKTAAAWSTEQYNIEQHVEIWKDLNWRENSEGQKVIRRLENLLGCSAFLFKMSWKRTQPDFRILVFENSRFILCRTFP